MSFAPVELEWKGKFCKAFMNFSDDRVFGFVWVFDTAKGGFVVNEDVALPRSDGQWGIEFNTEFGNSA